jgi:hypothetical protein
MPRSPEAPEWPRSMLALYKLSLQEFKTLWEKLLAEQDATLATLAPASDSKIESLIAEHDVLVSELRRRDIEKSMAPNATEATPLHAGERPRVDGAVPHKEGDRDGSPRRDALRSKMKGCIDPQTVWLIGPLKKDRAQFERKFRS